MAIFLPGESHGQRRLEGYGPQGHKSGTRLKRAFTAEAWVGEVRVHKLCNVAKKKKKERKVFTTSDVLAEKQLIKHHEEPQ